MVTTVDDISGWGKSKWDDWKWQRKREKNGMSQKLKLRGRKEFFQGYEELIRLCRDNKNWGVNNRLYLLYQDVFLGLNFEGSVFCEFKFREKQQ
jgi:hypothetical protein